ncbi:MAG: peptidoglycan-binding protein, partial [Actinomycetota bacterium]|nr:peptidoglycan-binding protein [Actinomycetota bacterium]
MERTLNRWMTVLFALLAPLLVVASPSSGTVSAIEPVDEIVAYVVEGTGNGHGRGLSQWGAYGWAVEEGKDWQWILDHYYGGTYLGDNDSNPRIRVRLTDFDGASWMGVISSSSSASWSAGDVSGSGASAIKVVEVAANQFDVSIGIGVACPGTSTLVVPDGPVSRGSSNEIAVRQIQTFLTAFGWDPKGVDGDFGPLTELAVEAFQDDEELDIDGIWKPDDATRAREIIAASTSTIGWDKPIRVSGPVVVTSSVDESTSSPGDVLGLCSGSGSVTHYR